MKFKQLEYFVTVAEAGSISRAAAQLYVSQPSLSFQISSLEKELGGDLFDRLPRGIQLSAAGRAFLVEARKILAAAGRAQGIVRAITEGNLGELRLSTITSLALGIVPEAASRWKSQYPNVTLGLEEFVHADTLEESTISGQCDIAVGPRPGHPMASLVPLGFEEFVFVLHRSDPLARREQIDLREVADRSWVLFSEDHGLAQLVDNICGHWGFRPQAAVRTGQVATAVKLTAAGLGPTLLPENLVSQSDNVAVRPLNRVVLRELTAYSDAPLSPLATSFINEIKSTGLIGKNRTTYPDALFL